MSMAMPCSVSNCASTRVCFCANLIYVLHPSSPVTVSFPLTRTVSLSSRLCAVPDGAKVGSPDALAPDSLRRPFVPPAEEVLEEEGEVDWEDQILEETVPLVGYVRTILHTGKYESGEKLSPEHEKTIRERLLPYHPESEKKIGPGIDYITIGYHPDFARSRCLFIVRKDGELVDFSYWKCIKGLIRKKYPEHADLFIHRHFQPRRNTL